MIYTLFVVELHVFDLDFVVVRAHGRGEKQGWPESAKFRVRHSRPQPADSNEKGLYITTKHISPCIGAIILFI